MRVIIKKSKTNKFYLGEGKWGTDRNSAKTFSTTVEAIRHCQKDKLDSDIVMSFRDARYDLKIPCPKK